MEVKFKNNFHNNNIEVKLENTAISTTELTETPVSWIAECLKQGFQNKSNDNHQIYLKLLLLSPELPEILIKDMQEMYGKLLPVVEGMLETQYYKRQKKKQQQNKKLHVIKVMNLISCMAKITRTKDTPIFARALGLYEVCCFTPVSVQKVHCQLGLTTGRTKLNEVIKEAAKEMLPVDNNFDFCYLFIDNLDHMLYTRNGNSTQPGSVMLNTITQVLIKYPHQAEAKNAIVGSVFCDNLGIIPRTQKGAERFRRVYKGNVMHPGPRKEMGHRIWTYMWEKWHKKKTIATTTKRIELPKVVFTVLPSVQKGDTITVVDDEGTQSFELYGGSLGKSKDLKTFVIDPFIAKHVYYPFWVIGGDEQPYESIWKVMREHVGEDKK